MRAALILGFLSNMTLTLVSLAILPERVAIHFGTGGLPNGWATNLTSTLGMMGFHILLFCILYFSPRLIAAVPSKWISLPHRDYWLTPERRPQTIEKFRRYLWQFGAAVFGFMLCAGLLTVHANLSVPIRLNERLFLIALGGFLVYTAYWTIALLRTFRMPH